MLSACQEVDAVLFCMTEALRKHFDGVLRRWKPEGIGHENSG